MIETVKVIGCVATIDDCSNQIEMTNGTEFPNKENVRDGWGEDSGVCISRNKKGVGQRFSLPQNLRYVTNITRFTIITITCTAKRFPYLIKHFPIKFSHVLID